MQNKGRPRIPIPTQVEVLFRDRWLCHLCGRPTVFHLTFKYLAEIVRAKYPTLGTAYWHLRSRRDAAPLLDELGACIDHVTPVSRRGTDDPSNLAVACGRCNVRKSARVKDEYLRLNPRWVVRGKHGEPTDWDGLSALFVALVAAKTARLSRTDREWLVALQHHFENPKTRQLANTGLQPTPAGAILSRRG